MPDSVSLEVIVSGGGIKNFFLMTSLKKYFLSGSISPIDAHGIPSSAKEALCFAVLANAWLHGNRTNMPSATGARKPTLLGSLSIG
jgi:anhydro-N-acetylmuramic acid kinase